MFRRFSAVLMAALLGLSLPMTVFATAEEADLEGVEEENGYYMEETGDDTEIIPVRGFEAYGGEEADEITEGLVGSGQALPESYRAPSVSGIGDQGSSGVCWAFSSLSCAENNLLLRGLTDSINFSETQLVYGVFHGDEDTYTRGSTNNGWYLAKGNYMMAAAALAIGYGAADENVYAFDNHDLGNEARSDDIAHIDRVLFLADWPSEYAWWKTETWDSVTDEIKSAVYTYGSVMATYYSGMGDYDPDLNSNYTGWEEGASKPTADHAITIVGWDDTKETQDSGNPGAYLVMNSWGTDWGDEGLFWIAYNDASLLNPAVFIMEDNAPGTLRDADVFSHTETGWTGSSSLKSATKAIHSMNVFHTDHAERIDRIGFYTNEPATYTAELIIGMTDGEEGPDPNSGTVAATATGYVDCAGFYKADLSEAVTIGSGQTFGVRVIIETANGHKVLFEGADKNLGGITRTTSVSPGESFYWSGSAYTDCSVDSFSGRRNACIYAYGNPTAEPTPEPTPEPTEEPTPEPTEEPTPEPTEEPTPEPTPEPSEDMTGVYYLRVRIGGQNRVLDISGGSTASGANAQIYTKNGSAAQRFLLDYAGDGYYRIVNLQSGKVLDVAGGSKANGTNIWQYVWNGSDAQLWSLEANGSGYSIVSKASGKVLDVAGGSNKAGTNVQLYASNKSAAQTWYLDAGEEDRIVTRLSDRSSSIESGKTYVLVPKQNPLIAVDVYNGNMVDWTPLWLYRQNGTEAQKFTLTRNDDGSYTFVNQKCELSIDVYNNSTENGAQVQLYTWNGTTAQKWLFNENSDGTYTIVNKNSGKVITCPNVPAEPTNYIKMYAKSGSDTQKFYLVETTREERLYPGTYYLAASGDPGYCIDIYNAGKADGTNAWLYRGNQTAAQQFRFVYSGDGTYRIVNVNSGKVLTIAGNSSAVGRNVQIETWRGEFGQRWRIQQNEGTITLVSAYGTVMDIYGGSVKNTTNIWTYHSNGTAAQQWVPVEAG